MVKLLSVFAIVLWASAQAQEQYNMPNSVVRLPRAALFGSFFGHPTAVAVPAPAYPAPAQPGVHGGPLYPQPAYQGYLTNSAYPHNGAPTAVPAPSLPGSNSPYQPVAVYAGYRPHHFLY